MYILRITFKSFFKKNQLQQNLIKLKKLNKLKNINIQGIFQIKNKNKIFTLLKSPHVNKKSREHFLYKHFLSKIDVKFKKVYIIIAFLF